MTWIGLFLAKYLKKYWEYAAGIAGAIISLKLFQGYIKKGERTKVAEENFKRSEDEKYMLEVDRQHQEKEQIEWNKKQKSLDEWRSSIDLNLLARDPVAKRMYDTDPLHFNKTYYPGQQFTRTEPEKKIP